MFITKDEKLTDLIINYKADGKAWNMIRERAGEIRRENPYRNCNFESYIQFEIQDEAAMTGFINNLKENESKAAGYLTTHEEHGEILPTCEWNGLNKRIDNLSPIAYKRIEDENGEVKEYKPIYRTLPELLKTFKEPEPVK